MPKEVLAQLRPEAVTPGLLYLASEEAPTKVVLCAGAGTFERAHVTLTQGMHVGTGADAPERVAQAFVAISDRAGEMVPGNGAAQGMNEITKGAGRLG